MKYKVIQKFGPTSENWTDFARWAGIEHCSDFYSIDSMKSPDLFTPETVEDWNNCVNESFMINFLTNLEYAQKIAKNFQDGEIVGVIIDPKNSKEKIPGNHEPLGYDILDGYNNISLLTNWGGEKSGIKDLKLNQNALITDIDYAYLTRDVLKRDFPDDDHAAVCEVWAVYKVNF